MAVKVDQSTRGVAKYYYRNNTGETHQPIVAGLLIKLSNQHICYNANMKLKAPHWRYLWIQTVQGIPKHRRPNRRKVRVADIHIPSIFGNKKDYFATIRRYNLDNLVLVLDQGFIVIDTECVFNGNMASWGKVYDKIGLTQCLGLKTNSQSSSRPPEEVKAYQGPSSQSELVSLTRQSIG